MERSAHQSIKLGTVKDKVVEQQGLQDMNTGDFKLSQVVLKVQSYVSYFCLNQG